MALVEVNAPREWVMYSLTDLSGAVRSILTTGAAYAKARVVARDVIDVDALTDALDRHQWGLLRATLSDATTIRPKAYDALSERTRRLRQNQLRGIVEFVAARVEQDVRQQIADALEKLRDKEDALASRVPPSRRDQVESVATAYDIAARLARGGSDAS
jgi:ribosomal protein S13